MASFDSTRMSSSFSSAVPSQVPYPGHQQQQQHQHQQSSSFSHPAPAVGLSRSFGAAANGFRPGAGSTASGNPQIYTAVYSGVMVYEMEVQGIAVMRRRSDSWLNATQILKVAGVDKGRRTKILEKEILTGEHEKVQGGYGRYQGTWISYQRGRQFCRQYDVEDILRPLLDYDISSDGTSNAGKTDTPTKEQAMAANRKRFYNAGLENKVNGSIASGTFFQNISPTASNALAAMNKAARFDSPVARPGSVPRRPSGLARQGSQSHYDSQGSGMPASQTSMHSFTDGDVNGAQADSGFASQKSMLHDTLEPPRKKLRPSSSGDAHPLDHSMLEDTPTEPNDSFFQPSQGAMDVDGGPISLPPLYPPTDKSAEEKRVALLSLFEDASRTDLSSNPALQQLSGSDLNMPLDASANTALHWAATLARVSLMRVLIARGANVMIGNAASQTPLMAAVQVNNSLDVSCFPQMLDILGSLIDVRDGAGRTVLHHIAVSSGIKGRAQSSRYYLESLLEYTVRQGSNPNSQSSANGVSSNASSQSKKTMNLTKFMSEVVNVQDKSGNTALNLVARIGNRPIINQLEEVGADFEIANNAGFKPTDFGVFPRNRDGTQRPGSQSQANEQDSSQAGQLEQIKEEIFATTNSILAQTQAQYQAELGKKQEVIDRQTAEIRDIATEHAETLAEFERLERRGRERLERQQRIANLKRAMKEQRARGQEKGLLDAEGAMVEEPVVPRIDLAGMPVAEDEDVKMVDGEAEESTPNTVDEAGLSFLSTLPTSDKIQAQLEAYRANNQELEGRVAGLRSQSLELENQYRRIVNMCTGVEESKVDEMVEHLVAAVESEPSGVVDVGRVREFLRKAEGAE